MPTQILVVDDNQHACRQLGRILERAGLAVSLAFDGREALRELQNHHYSLVVTDLKMPEMNGLELIRQINRRKIPTTIIVTTGHGSIDAAVEAMKSGAYHFLTKPFDPEQIQVIIHRALEKRALQDEVFRLREQLQQRYSFHNILSKNPRMHQIFELMARVANSTATVLIEGETGTGKELIAQALHYASAHRKGRLIAVNCAALPESLLESELFGHERGAFTGAAARRAGRFELAHGGTLFLDEVGEIPLPMQAKLLRVLENHRFERVGGTETIEVDVRVIAATNRPLQKLVEEGTFREDLYYRLNVIKISIPPLRERPEDIALLTTHFLQKYQEQLRTEPKTICPEAMSLLYSHLWPGNVRELENVIERAVVTTVGPEIRPENLPPGLASPEAADGMFRVDVSRPLPEILGEITERIEREYIAKALDAAGGSVGQAAEIAGMSRRSISSKVQKYNIARDRYPLTEDLE